MNSLIQQFYNISSIRESILVAKEQENNRPSISINSSLYQLKAIFASLKALESKAYNPKDFFLNFDNQLLNVTEQMDVDEFFNMLIDKLEPQIKDSCYNNPFYYEFRGSISNDIICKDCPHKSEREEGFNCIILSVKNSIKDSLNFYIQEEILEGDNAYICEKCDKKVNALRRACVKNLPRTLILVLKRFEFDYDINQKLKLNNYCEFPKELDMEPYTQEYLNSKYYNANTVNDENYTNNCSTTINNSSEMLDSDEQDDCTRVSNNYSKVIKPKDFYMYDLSGIIIHTGTAENGHYYSIINTTDIKDCSNKTWLEFNDSNVKPYDFEEDIANDAYGGFETIINKDNNKETVEKPSSAYVLIYKRKIDDTAELKKYQNIYENKYIDELVKTSASLNKLSRINSNLNYSVIPQTTNISQTLLDKVNEDNFKYWVKRNLFNEHFIKFVFNIMINYCYNNNNYNYDVSKNETKNSSYYNFNHTNWHILNNYSSKKTVSNNKTTNIVSMFKNAEIRSIENRDNSNIEKLLESYKCVGSIKEPIKLDNSEIIEDDKIFKFCCLTFFNIVIRAKDKQFVPVFIDLIKLFINKNIQNAKFILEEFSHIDVLNEYIIDNPLYEMRNLIVGVVNCAMIKFFNTEVKQMLTSLIDSANTTDDKLSIYNNKICKFLNTLLFTIHKYTYIDVQEMKDLTHVYLLILRFSQIGNEVLDKEEITNINTIDNKLSQIRLYTKSYLKNIGLLDYLLLTIINKSKQNTKSNENYKELENKTLTDLVQKLEIEMKHKNFSTKFMNKVDKLTNLEEVLEKKNIEKNLSLKHDQYLFMTLIEIMTCCRLDTTQSTDTVNKSIIDVSQNKILLDILTLKKIDIESQNFIVTIISETKIKPASVLVGKLLLQVCENNLITSNLVIEAFKKLLNLNDYYELDSTMRCLKTFILIEDSISIKRVKDSVNMLVDVFTENSKYFKFSEYLIDYCLKLFSTRKSFLIHIEVFKPLFTKMLKWLKENTYPPHFTQSKTCEMFKKKTHIIPNNTNPQLVNNFISKQQQLNNEKQGRISDLYKSKSIKKNLFFLKENNNNFTFKDYDSELDLTDFKFSIGDKVKVDGKTAVVTNVLDEMIHLEYDKQEISGTKRPEQQWIETESKLLEIIYLKPSNKSKLFKNKLLNKVEIDFS
jgi:ubiquitin C-terminal hydrolase